MIFLEQSNVQHVPDLKKILISLGTVDFKGYTFSAKGGVLSVHKDYPIVMKGKKVNTLYIFQYCTVTDAVVSLLEDLNLDTTCFMAYAIRTYK